MSGRTPDGRFRRLADFWELLRAGVRASLTSLPLGLLSFALALLIWVTVTNEENPSIRRQLVQEIPVEQVNVPRGLLPTNTVPAKVAVTITGPRNAVNDVRPEDVSVRVDLSRLDEEIGRAPEATVVRPVRAEVRRRGVRAEVSPDVVRVTLEREERRDVPVCVEKVDVPPPGFSVDEPIVTEPATVTVTGPRRIIDTVECAGAKVRLTGLTVSLQSQVLLEPRDAAGRAVGGVAVQPPTALLSARIRQDLFPRQVVIDVRLTGRPAPGFTVTSVRADPTLATVVGPLDVVQGLSSVATEVIDIEGARSDIVRAVSLQIPPGVSSGERRSVVTISLQVARAPGSVGVPARIVNLASGLTATPAAPLVVVLVSGPLPDVLALRPADLAVMLDAAGLGPGIHRLEPRVVAPPGISVDGTTPEQIDVTIGRTP